MIKEQVRRNLHYILLQTVNTQIFWLEILDYLSRTVTLWNALKPHFKLSESLITFKHKMKGYLLNQFLMP